MNGVQEKEFVNWFIIFHELLSSMMNAAQQITRTKLNLWWAKTLCYVLQTCDQKIHLFKG